MPRRASAAFLLLALSAQLGVGLYACGHSTAPAPAAAVRDHAAAHHAAHGDSGADSRSGCNRHHAGRCPHHAAAGLAACTSDPAAALQPGADVAVLPPSPPRALPAAAQPDPRPVAALLLPASTSPPEPPPPRRA